MTMVEMINEILVASGRAMSIEELIGPLHCMFGLKRWDAAIELLVGRSQVAAIAVVIDRDRDRAWFTDDGRGRYVIDRDGMASVLLG